MAFSKIYSDIRFHIRNVKCALKIVTFFIKLNVLLAKGCNKIAYNIKNGGSISRFVKHSM